MLILENILQYSFIFSVKLIFLKKINFLIFRHSIFGIILCRTCYVATVIKIDWLKAFHVEMDLFHKEKMENLSSGSFFGVLVVAQIWWKKIYTHKASTVPHLQEKFLKIII
jgi:hypothetical protein